MPASNQPQRNMSLEKMIQSSEVRNLDKAKKLTVLSALLHNSDPEGFKKLEGLTWPEGRAILISSNREMITKTNPTAQIKEIPGTQFLIDTGHDNAAMLRLIVVMMRALNFEAGMTNRVKSLFVAKNRNSFRDFLRNDPSHRLS